MKLEIIAPVTGKSWKVGHTVLISDQKRAFQLIEDGFAIHHPTVTDPPPSHECPCKEHDEPCAECDEKEIQEAESAQESDEAQDQKVVSKKVTTPKKKTTPPKK